MFITDIHSFIPGNQIDNVQLASTYGKSEDFVLSKIGALRLPRKMPNQTSLFFAIEAAQKLFKCNSSIKPENIDCILVVTQNPGNGGVPHISPQIQSALSISNKCHTFDISLACSGYPYALSIISSYMAANNLCNGLLITSDQYSDILDSDDKNTSLLFGDASAVTLVQSEPTSYYSLKINDISAYTDGNSHDAIEMRNGLLYMNGRNVFNFALQTVPLAIKNHLADRDLSLLDIDYVICHQGSKAIVESIRKKLELSVDKVPICIEQIGNTVSSSIPLVLKDKFFTPTREKNCNRILICGFGVGLSIATMILTKISKC
ncbi:3-oxoacyl-[acyl-carrier-protein] synthase III [Synechococcus sp. RCC307]|nr:3-oxoacyl-[acyl-carrier-protein] synthase III [Synechococcus sp. RCC307]